MTTSRSRDTRTGGVMEAMVLPALERGGYEYFKQVDIGERLGGGKHVVDLVAYDEGGRGLVATPSDFGAQGEQPTHPELLDWLAQELIRSGWRLKSLHKLMMTSSVYMQSADFDSARAKVDPDNFLHWRRTRHSRETVRCAPVAARGARRWLPRALTA